MTQAAAVAIEDTCPEDLVDMALAWHEGDVRKTIATLLEDCRHLREQLLIAQASMSRGMTRGWTPILDRP